MHFCVIPSHIPTLLDVIVNDNTGDLQRLSYNPVINYTLLITARWKKTSLSQNSDAAHTHLLTSAGDTPLL